jgi:hypothetical protein
MHLGNWLAVAFGIGIIASALAVLYNAHRTASWPSTTARILSSSVDTTSAGRTYYWVPSISFEYEVDGTTWVSWRYSASSITGFFLRSSVEKIVARHPVGSHASVVYPPFEPQRAILVRGARPVLSSAMRLAVLGLPVLWAAFHAPTE